MRFFDAKKQQPTHFREKILLNNESSYPLLIFDGKVGQTFNFTRAAGKPIRYNVFSPSPEGFIKTEKIIHPKLHTLREDSSDRWKAGMSIQMVYRGAGYKIIDEFNKGIPELGKCVSTQRIVIDWCYDDSPYVFIDDRELEIEEVIKLAINDGFESVEDFFAWFKKDFTGKIIHFTDFKY